MIHLMHTLKYSYSYKNVGQFSPKNILNDLRCINSLYMCVAVCTALTHDLHVSLFVLTPVI